MLNPFKRNKDYPQTELEQKWNFVGFFSAFLLCFILAMPLLIMSGQLRNVTELSTNWFGLIIGMIAWPTSVLFTLKWWIQLSHNFGLYMYQMEQLSEKKNRV